MQGAFIVLEGPDGSGTTTHAGALAARLEGDGHTVLLTHEPSKGPIGLFIREQLQHQTVPVSALQMLFSADRAWHLEDVVLPALSEGKIVISDRYALSTILYGKALGLDEQWLKDMNKIFIQPTCELLALPSFDLCQGRLRERSTKDVLEEDSLQRKVYDAYTDYASKSASLVIDTAGDLAAVSEQFYEAVKRALPKQ
ncbi:MAG TPA: dTMP kinase [Candidatus Peribacteraceae bacterium]|nr:dTMP kinase [Candidatus Peribacteraceae bacterium]